MDGDGMITKDELRKLVEKVGGSMTEGEAKGLIHQADKDGNESIDFSEFSKLWAAIKGEGEVRQEDVIANGYNVIFTMIHDSGGCRCCLSVVKYLQGMSDQLWPTWQ